MEIINIDEIRTAVYEGILMANCADDIDRWDIVSRIKFKALGWAALAKEQLELEQEQQGGGETITKKDIARKAREIQRSVETRRKNQQYADEAQDDWGQVLDFAIF